VASRDAAFGPVDNNQFSAALAASYEIDLWGQQNANSNAADYDAQAAAFDTQTILISVSAELVATYLDVLYWRELDQVLGVQQELQ
jgi:outer membrane protein TolC